MPGPGWPRRLRETGGPDQRQPAFRGHAGRGCPPRRYRAAGEAGIHRGHRSRRTQPPQGRHGALGVCRVPASRPACGFGRLGPGGWHGTRDGRRARARKSGTTRTGELAAPQRRPGRGHVPGCRSARRRPGERGKRIGNSLRRVVRQLTFRPGRRFPRWPARRSDLSPGDRPGHRRYPDLQTVRAGPGTRRGLAAPAAVARSPASSPAGHRSDVFCWPEPNWGEGRALARAAHAAAPFSRERGRAAQGICSERCVAGLACKELSTELGRGCDVNGP